MKVSVSFKSSGLTPATSPPAVRSPAAPSRRARALGGMPGAMPSWGTPFPYEAASWSTPEMGDWQPQIRSPDAEINQFRDRMVARVRDHVRNDGMASGGVERILDNTVGANLRLRATPDYRALAAVSGKKAFDAVWADEFRSQAEALWRLHSHDHGRYADVERQLIVPQQQRLALRHKLVDGDALLLNYWMPERIGRGAARYATAFQVVDPDRLSNPYQEPDSKYLRGGVELDDDGVAIAYWIRKAEPNDYFAAADAMTWERVPREDVDGWRRVIHDYDVLRASQRRGVGVFAPVLGRLKMLARYYGLELQQAAIGAALGTYVTSPYDAEQVMDAIGGDNEELSAYQQLRADWHDERPAMFNGVKVPTLAPGEDIKTVSAAHPHEGFEAFAHEMQAAGASALGLTLEQFNQRWAEMNYSSARASLLEMWKTLTRRRQEFAANTCTPMYATWLHEPMERGELPLPAGAPDYLECRTAYAGCHWLGPARGWIDPVKEPQGSVLKMDAGLSSLQAECAEQGLDAEEVLDQRAVELGWYRSRGLTPPSWAAMNIPAERAAQPIEEPQAR